MRVFELKAFSSAGPPYVVEYYKGVNPYTREAYYNAAGTLVRGMGPPKPPSYTFQAPKKPEEKPSVSSGPVSP
jgi:hypothetical protein